MAVNIATSIDLFAQYRSSNCYYVDKTGFIEELIDQGEAAYLFTRPRRFGKTLFLSMLAEFFDITKDSRDLFAGLKVAENEALCREWMNRYPVIFLSLKDVSSLCYERALGGVRGLVSDFCREHRYLLESPRLDTEERRKLEALRSQKADMSTLVDALLILTRAMRYHHGKPAIVLIDEYDSPVLWAARYGYHDKMTNFMRRFLSSGLKTNDNLMFAVLTGCVRIPLADDYGGLNNLKCYGISDSDYAETFGFTQIEVDRLLLDAALFPRRQEFREWYGGYHMSGLEESYCPASVMDYLCDVQDNPDTSPRVYMDYSLEKNLIEQLTEGDAAFNVDRLMGVQTDIDVCIEYNEERLWRKELLSRLLFAGFLTGAPDYLEEDIQRAGAYMKILSVPNREVREIFVCVVQQGR